MTLEVSAKSAEIGAQIAKRYRVESDDGAFVSFDEHGFNTNLERFPNSTLIARMPDLLARADRLHPASKLR